MITHIRIRGLGVIEDSTLDLGPGLNVLTGETGAGKTMVVTGLGLLLGARADTGVVRHGADAAVVEGLLDVDPQHPAARRAEEAGGDVQDGLVLVRTVSGRGSRAHVGGRAAPAAVLTDIGRHVVAVHGQADQWRLRRSSEHREVLDRFGGESVAAAAAAYREAHRHLLAVQRDRTDLRSATRERAREAAALSAALETLERVDPQPGEEDALEQEIGRLTHAETLQAAAARAHEALASDETGGAAGLVSGAADDLTRAGEHDPDLAALATRVAEIGYLAHDVAADLHAYADRVEADPHRLAHLQERVADLGPILRAYGPTCADAVDYGARAAARLTDLTDSDERLERIAGELAQARRVAGRAALALSRARLTAAGALQDRVATELAHLAMGGTRLVVDVEPTTPPTPSPDESEEPADDAGLGDLLDDGVLLVDPDDGGPLLPATATGVDTVHLRLDTGAGEPRSLVKAASGGELSRVMLALELVTSAGEVPTLVFDEVDAGVGGSAALDLGRRLAALAHTAQVIVVTHLPQVAALADRHLVVTKGRPEPAHGGVTSTVTAVSGADREAEIARMLAGSSEADVARQHARDLLAQEAPRRAHPESEGDA